MLTYKMGTPEIYRGDLQSDNVTRRYRPPIKEFQVDRIDVPHGRRSVVLETLSTPSILLCQNGQKAHLIGNSHHDAALALDKGRVFLIGANVTVEVKTQSGLPLTLFRAACNL
jgi:mannose-6-phosphate isomerase class I